MSNTEPDSQARSSTGAPGKLPSLAVIIPTLNRPHDLTITVRTLLAQTILPQELIIVDQSPDDESQHGVRALLADRPHQAARISLQYTRDPEITGAAAARNLAFEQNHCDIILFLDDDVELEPDFVERLLESYADDPGLTGISGIITNYKPGGFAVRAWQWVFVRGPFRDERQAIYHRADELRRAGRIPVTRFGGGLMSFRAGHIGDLRFDENLRGTSDGEDVDFCMRLPAGARLELDPRARLVHNASAAARKNEHWIAAIVRGSSYLYYRNWRHGWSNALAFAWLMTGFAIQVTIASLKRASLTPWKSLAAAARYGKEVGLGKKR